MMTEPTEERLLASHLAFLAAHRGSLRTHKEWVHVDSDRSEFTYAIAGPRSRPADLPGDTGTVQRLASSPLSQDELAGLGFQPAFGISYMTLDPTRSLNRGGSALLVERATTPSQMDVFSQVQSRGFNETPESFAHWHPWLKAANDRNRDREDQFFFVGFKGESAVGTTLLFMHDGVAGIYAVATLPSHRQQGISTTLLGHAVRQARDLGAFLVTLQVLQDSPVEDFYRRLGFQRRFTTGFFRRPRP